MHIPDNYLSPVSCAVMGAAMVPVWAVSIKKVKTEVSKIKMPQLGIGAAFSFLIMMFNVPVPGGTTAHAIGGTLLAVLLGPWSASVCISVALLLQALLFGDGGILAFGANAFNMAFVLPFVGYFVYKFIKDRVSTSKGEYVGLAVGSYFGINAAALFAALEFGVQPLLFKSAAGVPLYSPYPLSVSIPAMLIPHLTVAGLAEMFFTVSIFAFVKKVSPGMIFEGRKKKANPIIAALVALVCLSPLGLLAAGTAWGEWGTGELGGMLGYLPGGMRHGLDFSGLLADYGATGLPAFAGYILSAVIGAAVLIIIFRIIGSMVREKDHPVPAGAHFAQRTCQPHPPGGAGTVRTAKCGGGSLPSWLLTDEAYTPASDRDAFIDRSILSFVGILSRIRTQDGKKRGQFKINAFFAVLFTLALVVLVSMSRTPAFVYIALAYLLALLCVMPAGDVKAILKVSAIASLVTAVILIPTVFFGNYYSIAVIPLKVFVTITAVNILSHAIRWDHIIIALKRFHLPDLIIFVLDITLKYIVMLGDLALSMLYALKLRSVGRNRGKRAALSGVAGTMFIRSREMAEEMYQAMECRGFDGEYRIRHKFRVGVADIVYLALNAGFIAVFVWLY